MDTAMNRRRLFRLAGGATAAPLALAPVAAAADQAPAPPPPRPAAGLWERAGEVRFAGMLGAYDAGGAMIDATGINLRLRAADGGRWVAELEGPDGARLPLLAPGATALAALLLDVFGVATQDPADDLAAD